MSKKIHVKGTQFKAPKQLVEAAKKGERITVTHHSYDTKTNHVRRFTLALAVAALLLGGVAFLPSLLNNSAPALSQPGGNSVGQSALENTDHAVPSDDYIRPDLVWADETNRLSEDILFSWLEYRVNETDEYGAGRWFCLPDYPDDTVYAVKAYAQSYIDFMCFNEDKDLPLPPLPDSIITYLTETLGWERFTGPDGELCFAVTKAQIEALESDSFENATLFDISLEAFEDELVYDADTNEKRTYEGIGFHLVIAWQSHTNAAPITPIVPGSWEVVK